MKIAFTILKWIIVLSAAVVLIAVALRETGVLGCTPL